MFYSILYYFDLIVAIRTGFEPATSAVTGRHSNQLNYRINFLKSNCKLFAIRTGFEPATSAVTGRHSNQLNYRIIRIRNYVSFW